MKTSISQLLDSPKHKVVAASAGLALVLTLASLQGLSAGAIARVLLGLAAAGGGVAWALRIRNPQGKKFQLAPRLSVVSRAGLSQRAGLALVEVDGRAFLVVHGDGYAEICPTTEKPRPAPVRPPRATDSQPKLNPRRTAIQ